ncbi:unnamed protein product, partial [Trichobilharzia szidati]
MQSNTKFPILSLKRLRQRNLRLTCHYTTFYRRYKRNYAQLLASMSTEAVTPAVLPVEVESSSVNTDTMTVETEVVSSPPCSSLTPYNRQKKTYVVLTKPGVNEYFLAAKRWMLTDNVCLYPSSVTECEVEACVNPAVNWLIVPCQIVVEKDSFREAKSALSSVQRVHNILSNSVNLEETLPLTDSKRQRVGTRNFASYLYDSAELEAVEAQKVCRPSKYPNTNFMAPTASTSSQQMPVATSSPITQPNRQTTKEITDSYNKSVTESHSLSEKLKSLEGKIDFLNGKMASFQEEMQSLSKLVRQFVSVNKSGDVTTLGTGKSSIDNSQLQFPLTTEEEFNQLEASVKNPKFRDSFVSSQLTFNYVQMTKLAENLSYNPQSSLKRMLNYIWEPKLSSRFTAYGTSKKLALLKCHFYKVITSVIVSKFASATMPEDEVMKALTDTTKAYFLDVRDRVDKRCSRPR